MATGIHHFQSVILVRFLTGLDAVINRDTSFGQHSTAPFIEGELCSNQITVMINQITRAIERIWRFFATCQGKYNTSSKWHFVPA